MEVRVKITYLIVVGANCLSSSPIGRSEWGRCQLSKTITQDCKEHWKHEDFVYGSKGQDHLPNNSWCKLPEFIRIGSSEWWTCHLLITITQDCKEHWKHEDFVYVSKGQDHLLNSSWCKLPEFIPIGSSEWWLCQLSKTIIQDYQEDWKHKAIVYVSKGQDHLLNSSWCELPEFISYRELEWWRCQLSRSIQYSFNILFSSTYP